MGLGSKCEVKIDGIIKEWKKMVEWSRKIEWDRIERWFKGLEKKVEQGTSQN